MSTDKCDIRPAPSTAADCRRNQNGTAVVALSRATDVSRDLVGPKAASLVRLRRARLPVPPAFCVTAPAYVEHLHQNGIDAWVRRASCPAPGEALEVVDERLREIRERILATPIADRLTREISTHLHALPRGPFAIRSSGTAEDLPGHSFAGLHDTVLGVRDLDGCLEAVRQCWASLWSLRAFQYREKNGFDHLATAIAVIVQQLVPADAAGVAFTANPLTGRRTSITIESCHGLGDTLVSGRVTPDRFTFRRKGPKLMYSLVGEKTIASRPSDGGRVEEYRVEPDRARVRSIDARTARRVARLALRAERTFGCPQDLEWAVHGRRVYLLQSRPITAIPEPLSWEDRQVWTNINFAEVVPDVVTPATRSFLLSQLDRIFGSILRILCVDPGEHRLADIVAGRLYFNVNTALAMFGHLPAVGEQDVEAIFGGAHGKLYRCGRLDLGEEDLPPLGGSMLKVLLRLPRTAYDIYSHRHAKAEAAIRRLAAANRRLAELDVRGATTEELVSTLQKALRSGFGDLDLLGLFTTLFALPVVYELTKRWLDDPDGTLASRLFTGMGDMADAEAGFALWRLADIARLNPGVERAIVERRPWSETKSALSAVPGEAEFLAAWKEFAEEYGHHCRGEMEFHNPRWAETPDYCLDMIRSYLSCMGESSPEDHRRQRARVREQATEECRRRLRNPLKRALFFFFVWRARLGVVLRENAKNEAVRLVAAVRGILLELGGRLAADGVLAQPDDVFFVDVGEIGSVARGDLPPALRETIEARRVEHDRFESVDPPAVIVGRFDPDDVQVGEIDASAAVLEGISVSPGVVTGKARVILNADNEGHVEPGEILVAPFTDPGWTPYFLPAAAIVMDQGGILSHGSIIAREYGIPAVVNVGPATRIIRTGETITVDADRGMVTIHREPETG